MTISCRQVSKTFEKTTAVNQVTLSLEENKIYGLLGRNGAGKTTLLRMLANYIRPTSGEITFDGQPLWENETALRQIFLATENSFFSNLKIKELLPWFAHSFPNFDKEQCLNYAKQFGLDCNKSVQKLSTGYRSVLRVIIGLSVHTPFLLLDEPTLGMDAFHRELFYKLLIESYSQNPSCILLSTHLIAEVEGLLENIIIMDHGKIVIDQSLEQLLSQGYCISGKISEVDEYCKDKNVIGADVVGGLKTAAVLGRRESCPASLEQSGLSLQQLFVRLVGEEQSI